MTHFLPRAILIAASTAALAACATNPAPRYPIQEGQEPGEGAQGLEMRQPAYPVRQAEPPAPAPEFTDEPAPTTVPSSGSIETTRIAPPPEPEPQPYVPPPPPRTETRTVTSIDGPVVAVDGKPKTYTVKPGQGLDAVAREMGSTRKQLAADNDLKEPYRLKPGQTLKGPASKGKAYVVQSGDTLYAIARRFNVAAPAIAEENGFELDDPIRPGQKLRLPEGFKDSGPIKKTITVTLDPEPAPPPRPRPRPPVQQPAPQPTPPAPVSQPPPVKAPPVKAPPIAPPPVKAPPVVAPPVATPPPVRTPAPTPPPLQDDKPPVYTDADYARMAAGRFEWPVRGTVLSGYGPKAMGQRNDGVDIGASAGTPVRAAADGTVVYSGGDVPGFGVTVLIQHADGWVTVYGHLQRADVKMQQRVSRGQQIGQVGSSGDAPRPQLHFEVRYSPSSKFKAKAIDPQLVLPK
jgi:murein DD-endopeptidase MepM/ murein hydrolase activator NlpD